MSAPADSLEQDADRIAGGMLRSRADAAGHQVAGGATVQSSVSAPVVQRVASSGATATGGTLGSAFASRVSSTQARGGEPLTAGARSFFEPRLGLDLGSVRLHRDAGAGALARDAGARAFTVGTDIFFGKGEFRPETRDGRRLIAHEMAHVGQQATIGTRLQRECKKGEGPPAEEPPIPGEPGAHPLIYRGTSALRSRRPAVGDAQGLLNRFLDDLETKPTPCKPGADLDAIQRIRSKLNQDPLEVDCRFGPNTEKATLMFQRCVFPKAPQEWDGKIGEKTWSELDKLRPSPTKPTPKPIPPKPTPSTKPGAQTPCERTCHFEFEDCLKESSLPPACIVARQACLASCAGAQPAFEVCARLLQPPVEISGCNHAYVETPTRRYAIITPCTPQITFAEPILGGVAKKTDASPDPCGRKPTCLECIPKPGVKDLEACFASQFAAYTSPSRHKLFGPNSNTFAGTLARACCANMDPKPAALGCLFGWDDPPAGPPLIPFKCPKGPTVC